MGEWREVQLQELTLKIGSGATPKGGSNAYKAAGISLIRSQNVLDFEFGFEGLAFIDEEQASRLDNVSVEKNDVLLNITGDSVARCCIVDNKCLPARVNQLVAIIRLKPDQADYRYVFYSLQSSKAELLSMSEIGATRRALTKGLLESFEIEIPSLPEQKAIAEVLSSLDDKIDLLYKQNQTLEALAETLFRHTFIDNAKDHWEERVLGQLVETNVSAIKKDYPHAVIQYLDTGSLTRGITEDYQEVSLDNAPSRAKRLVEHNDVLISTVRPNQRHYGIAKNPIENLFVSTGFCVISCTEIDPHFVYVFLTTDEMTEHLHMLAEASTSAYPSLKPSDIEKLEIQLPPDDLLDHFAEQAESFWRKIEDNQKQIQTLGNLRDTLLPKLMSGEIRMQY